MCVLILFRMTSGRGWLLYCPPDPERRYRYPGRLRVPDRAALAGILYVLRTGVAWRDVPAETVGCSGVTAWRRLRDWTEAGVWPRLHAALLTELRRARASGPGRLCRGRVPRPGAQRGDHVGPSPVDRARPGSKHHLIVDRHGTPLASPSLAVTVTTSLNSCRSWTRSLRFVA